jgi:hypothetical protein
LELSDKKKIEKSDLFPFVVDTTQNFQMKIQYKENDFSGRLLMKPTEDKSLHIMFVSDFGITVFDFELSETDFKLNRIIEPLQKKQVLNLFEKDFRALFSYHFSKEMEAKVYRKEPHTIAYKLKTQDGKAYYLTQENQLKRIEMPGIITALQIDFQKYKNNFPEGILIVHPRLKLSMQLERVEQ